MPVKDGKIVEEDEFEEEAEEENSNADKDIEEQILKNQQAEENVSTAKVNYKKDKYAHDATLKTGLDFSKYEEYTVYGEMTDSGDFLNAMGLQGGLKNVTADPKKFNKAFLAAMKKDFFRITIKAATEENKMYVKKTVMRDFRIALLNYGKEDIIDRAKGVRARCFNLLTGCGDPNKANPLFVKEITEMDDNGKLTTRLGYDYAAIDNLVSTFEDDEKLYKSAITNIKAQNFASYYRNLGYCSRNKDGENVQAFDTTGVLSSVRAISCAREYNALKQIHAARPWHYWFTSPIQNYYEGDYLKQIRRELIDVASQNDFGDEMEKAMNSENSAELDENCLKLQRAVYASYGIEEEEAEEQRQAVNVEENKTETLDTVNNPDIKAAFKEDVKEEVIDTSSQKDNPNRTNIEIDNNQIEPVADEKDADHPYQVDGYGMSEKTVFLSKEEYQRIHQKAMESEHEPSLELEDKK